MKKISLITLAVVFGLSTGAFARDLLTGTISLSGGSSFSFESSTMEYEGGYETDIDTFDLNFAVGYFMIDNLQAGLRFVYESSEVSDDEETLIGFEPFVQYHLPISYQLNAVFGLGLGYYSLDYGDSDGNGFGFAVNGGIEYFLIDSVALNAGLIYRAYTLDFDGNDVDVSSMQLGAGITVYFN